MSIAGATCRDRSWHAWAIVVSGDPKMVTMNLHDNADRGAAGLNRIRSQLAHHKQVVIDQIGCNGTDGD